MLADLAGLLFVHQDYEFIPGLGHSADALDLHGNGRTGLGHPPALVVQHGPYPAVENAADIGVSLPQETFLDQDRGHRPPALVQPGLYYAAPGRTVRPGLEFQDVGLQEDHVQKLVHPLAGLGRNFHEDRLSAPGFGDEADFHHLPAHFFRVGSGLVHFVYGHHDGHARGLGVVGGFPGLGHQAVIGGHDENDDVRDLGAPGTHGREGFVPGRVQEGDVAAAGPDVIGPDVLGDAPGLAALNVGFADIVQE